MTAQRNDGRGGALPFEDDFDDSDDEPQIGEREMRMMAYLDDELPAADRREFENQLAVDAALAVEFADYRSLRDLTDSMRTLEPADLELRRFWSKFYNRTEWQLGWLLVSGGSLVLVGFLAFWIVTCESIPLPVRIATIAIGLGGLLLLTNSIRCQLRARKFDRYRGVMR